MEQLNHIRQHLLAVYADVVRRAEAAPARRGKLPPDRQLSRDNLLAYAAFREHDVHDLQASLSETGLSSLGRLESAVLASLEAVIERTGAPGNRPSRSRPSPAEARGLLAERSSKLFGRPRPDRSTRVMVTLDATAASEPALFDELLLAGVDAVRINTAHDTPAGWLAIISALRDSEARLAERRPVVSRQCHVMMDLAGPKLRTGPIDGPPPVLKLKTRAGSSMEGELDASPGATSSAPSPEAGFVVAVDAPSGLWGLRGGDLLTFDDARGRQREFHVGGELRGDRLPVHLHQTARLAQGTTLRADGEDFARVRGMEPCVGKLSVLKGDLIRLHRDAGFRGRSDARGIVEVGCTLPEALEHVALTDRVYFDDGAVTCVVTATSADALELVVVAPEEATRIGAAKGINLPDSAIVIPALTAEDREHLVFVASHADAVAMSFVHSPEDLRELFSEVRRLGNHRLGVVAKIETREAVQNLGLILLAGLEWDCFGVMIARGDLAVEAGFESLAMLQEEILCLGEACHTPVIWATQVLETLAKRGLPARSEITDAAAGQRAECVMLNKGAHIVDAVKILRSLLVSEERHLLKKRQIFRDFIAQPGLLGPVPGDTAP